MQPISSDKPTHDFKLDLRAYWRIFWGRKFLVLAPIVISGLVAGIGVRFLTPVFESSAVLEVRDEKYLSREVEQQFIQDQPRRRDHDRILLQSIEATIMGKEFQDKLIDRLGLNKLAAMREEAEEVHRTRFPHMTTDEILNHRLRKLLAQKSKVKRAGPRLFRISFADHVAENSFVLAGAISELFVELQGQKQLQGLRTAAEFSDEQIAIYRQAVKQSEQELEDFQKSLARREFGGGPVNETNSRQAENLQQQLRVDISEARGLRAKVKRNLGVAANTVPDDGAFDADPRLGELEDDLAARRVEQLLLELDGEMGGGASAENEAALRTAEAAMQRYLNVFVRDNYPALGSDYSPLLVEYYYQRAYVTSLERKAQRLASGLRRFRDRRSLAPEDERELERLRKEAETNRDLLASFVRAKASTSISEAVQHMDLGYMISVVESPERPMGPVRPNKTKILMLAVLFGGAIGIGGLILTEYMDSSFSSIDDIERDLGVRVLGTIPAMGDGAWNKETSVKRRFVWVTASLLIAALSISGFYFYGKRSQKEVIRLGTAEHIGSGAVVQNGQ